MKPYKGFTLVELLVVIAIIGVLSVIVFTASAGSRTKAGDAAVKIGMSEARSQIELHAALNGSYGNTFSYTLCPVNTNPPDPLFYSDTKLRNIIANIKRSNGSDSVTCASGGGSATAANTWAIASPIPTLGPDEQWWCADSTGNSKLAIVPGYRTPLAKLLKFFTPTAFAMVPPGPNLGGGSIAAICL